MGISHSIIKPPRKILILNIVTSVLLGITWAGNHGIWWLFPLHGAIIFIVLSCIFSAGYHVGCADTYKKSFQDGANFALEHAEAVLTDYFNLPPEEDTPDNNF